MSMWQSQLGSHSQRSASQSDRFLVVSTISDSDQCGKGCSTPQKISSLSLSSHAQTAPTTSLTAGIGGLQRSAQGAKTSSPNSNELALVRMGYGLRFVRVL
jgi:hypothetical protein